MPHSIAQLQFHLLRGTRTSSIARCVASDQKGLSITNVARSFENSMRANAGCRSGNPHF